MRERDRERQRDRDRDSEIELWHGILTEEGNRAQTLELVCIRAFVQFIDQNKSRRTARRQEAFGRCDQRIKFTV